MPDIQEPTVATTSEVATLTHLTDAISYIIIPRSVLAPPKPSAYLSELRHTDPERYNCLIEEQEYEHYDKIRTIFKLRSDHDIRLFPIGNKRDQLDNPYAKVFNGRIQNIPVDFSTHLLMLRIDTNLLPQDFTTPLPDESYYR